MKNQVNIILGCFDILFSYCVKRFLFLGFFWLAFLFNFIQNVLFVGLVGFLEFRMLNFGKGFLQFRLEGFEGNSIGFEKGHKKCDISHSGLIFGKFKNIEG